MSPQPLIAVHDLEASSAWYQTVLGLQSGHRGPEYERLMSEHSIVMQLHRLMTQGLHRLRMTSNFGLQPTRTSGVAAVTVG